MGEDGTGDPDARGQPRVNSLVATQDALHEGSLRNVDDEPELAAMQKMLFGLLTDCQFAGEKRAGLDKDEDEPPTHMKLVTD